MLIQTGLSPSLVPSNKLSTGGHAPARSNPQSESPRTVEQDKDKSAFLNKNSVRFEGYSQPISSLGKATTSYQSHASMSKAAVSIGQHVDIRI